MTNTEAAQAPVIYQSDRFDVVIGRLPTDELDQYLIINRKYGVVEFACNTELTWRDWIPEIERRLKEQRAPTHAPNVTQLHLRS